MVGDSLLAITPRFWRLGLYRSILLLSARFSAAKVFPQGRRGAGMAILFLFFLMIRWFTHRPNLNLLAMVDYLPRLEGQSRSPKCYTLTSFDVVASATQ